VVISTVLGNKMVRYAQPRKTVGGQNFKNVDTTNRIIIRSKFSHLRMRSLSIKKLRKLLAVLTITALAG